MSAKSQSASGALPAGPEGVVVTSHAEEVILRSRLESDAYDRLQITADGAVKTGPGVSAPQGGIPATQTALAAHDASATAHPGTFVTLTTAQTVTGAKLFKATDPQVFEADDGVVSGTPHGAYAITNTFSRANGGYYAAYWDSGANLNLFTSLIVSGTSSGVGLSRVVAPSPQFMLGVWSDLAQTEPAAVIRGSGPMLHTRDTWGFRRLQVDVNGSLSWADTGLVADREANAGQAVPANDAALDTNLYRNGVGILKTDGQLQVAGTLAAQADLSVATDLVMTSGGGGIHFRNVGVSRFSLTQLNGTDLTLRDLVNNRSQMLFGGGANNTDAYTFMYCSLSVQGNIGFYGTSAVAKQTVTGSRGGNAALASLLTALAATGLLTDSSIA